MKKYFSEFGGSPTRFNPVRLKRQEDNAEPTPEQLAWLAGIFDGEGSIILNFMKKRKYPYIGFHITNTNISLLSKVQMILQIILNRPIKMYKKKNTNYSVGLNCNMQCYSIDFRAQKDVFKVLNLLMPYLTSKKPKAMLVLEYLKQRLLEQHIVGNKNTISNKSLWFARLIMNNWRGVETEREALKILEMKPQSDLHSNMESIAEMTMPRFIAE